MLIVLLLQSIFIPKYFFKGGLLHFLESDNSNYEDNVTASDFDRIEQTSTHFST